MLEKVPTFIYIDNILGQDELRQLFPKDMNKAKKVRLLLTTRNIDLRRVLKMKTIVYDMKGLLALQHRNAAVYWEPNAIYLHGISPHFFVALSDKVCFGEW